jgi:hypothetical protein
LLEVTFGTFHRKLSPVSFMGAIAAQLLPSLVEYWSLKDAAAAGAVQEMV